LGTGLITNLLERKKGRGVLATWRVDLSQETSPKPAYEDIESLKGVTVLVTTFGML
jgi:hypothetical protein